MIHSVVLLPNQVILWLLVFFFPFPPRTFNIKNKQTKSIGLIFAFEAHMKHILKVPAKDEQTFVKVLNSQNEYSLLALPLKQLFYFTSVSFHNEA